MRAIQLFLALFSMAAALHGSYNAFRKGNKEAVYWALAVFFWAALAATGGAA